MHRLLTTIVLSSIMILVSSLTREVKRYELFCAIMALHNGELLYGRYLVSGYNEKGVTMEILSPLNEVLKMENEREGSFKVETSKYGDHKLCFRNFETEPVLVTFEVFSNHTSIQTNMINSKHINQVDGTLTDVINELAKVQNNQKFEDVRARVHHGILEVMASKIQWSSFFKLVALAGVGAGQVFVIRNLFRNKARASV